MEYYLVDFDIYRPYDNININDSFKVLAENEYDAKEKAIDEVYSKYDVIADESDITHCYLY